MARESFSSDQVANILNKHFIPIMLDRESRPDLDDIYMNFVTATTGAGGWPLNVFLTPDLKPIFGGTYWPGPALKDVAQQTAQTPITFIDILGKIQELWTTQRERCLQSSSDITNQLREFAAEGTHSQSSVQVQGNSPSSSDPPEPLELDLFDDALDHFISRYDSTYGGFGSNQTAPKFPTPANLTFLLRIGAAIASPSTHTRFGFFSPVPGILGQESCVKAASMSLHTLFAMSRSGLRDQLGYGFHRYSVTPDWNLPHFEKMMCDNAQLLGCYCDAWALGRNPEILGVIYNLVEYFTNPDSPIVRPEGGWYSSENADSRTNLPVTTNGVTGDDSKEGAFYVWTLKELQSILGDQSAAIVARHFGVKSDGNVPTQHDVNDEFLNQNVLSIQATPSVLAKEFGLSEEEIVRIIKSGRLQLLEYRKTQRSKPEVDTKVIASWNGLAISSLARAANTLATIDKNRSQRCQLAAENAVRFIRREMFDESTGEVTRIYNWSGVVQGREAGSAFVDDYAYLTLGALALYDFNNKSEYLEWAIKLQATLDARFIADTSGGYFQAARSMDQIMRLKPGTDNALPSPNGVICQNLLYLSSYQLDQQDEYINKARKVLNAFAVEIIQHPFLYVSLLAGLVLEQFGVKHLVAPDSMRDRDVRKLRGFGRTVIRGNVPAVMICTKQGVCRELRDSDLNDVDDDDTGDDQLAGLVRTASAVPAASTPAPATASA
jgi:uncharacterized protein YyaL (SSP411 family)